LVLPSQGTVFPLRLVAIDMIVDGMKRKKNSLDYGFPRFDLFNIFDYLKGNYWIF
jgi:hypothetical protein